jgi:3-isopropylmalate/(R)-2-methylmalate dehydratase small subunit
LIVNQNFGCGSAREQAAYALYDYGIRAIVAPSFGEIFRLNCVRTGIIPAIVSDEDAGTLHSLLDSKGRFMSIDLQNRLVTADSVHVKFDIEDVNAERLINDRDEIEETLALEREISAFELRM